MKKGECKHFVDALLGKFFGSPEGLAVPVFRVEHFQALHRRDVRVDFLADRVEGVEGISDNPLVTLLHVLREWQRAQLLKSPPDARLTRAEFRLEMGESGFEDVSGIVTRTLDVARDEGGRAYPVVEKRTVHSRNVPWVTFSVRVSFVFDGEEISKAVEKAKLSFTV